MRDGDAPILTELDHEPIPLRVIDPYTGSSDQSSCRRW